MHIGKPKTRGPYTSSGNLRNVLITKLRTIPRRTKSILIIASVLLLTGAGIVYYVYDSKRIKQGPDIKDKPFSKVIKDADRLAAEKKYDEALALYEAQLARTSNKQQRYELLLGKAVTCGRADRHSCALENYQAADAIKSESTTLIGIAAAHENLGNREKAVEAYRRVLEYLKVQPNKDALSEEIEGTKLKIENLERAE